MGGWKLWFVLLLPLTLCINREATFVRTTGREPFVTPICTNKTEDNSDINTIITLLVCRISTERSSGEVCRLLFQYGRGFMNECGSRFTFRTENQTVMLHLTSLTPEDSGIYTCECSRMDGTNTLRLNITVEEDEDISSSTKMPFTSALIGVTITIIIDGVIVGFIHWTNSPGDRSAASGTSECETSGSLDHDDPDDPCTRVQQATNVLFQTDSSLHCLPDTNTNSANSTVTYRHIQYSNNQEINEKKNDPYMYSI